MKNKYVENKILSQLNIRLILFAQQDIYDWHALLRQD